MVESAHYHDLEVVGSSHTTNKKNYSKQIMDINPTEAKMELVI